MGSFRQRRQDPGRNGSKFHELGLGADGSYSGKPWVSDLKSVAQSEGCRRKEEEKALSFQMIKDWPGKNPAFIALDSWGRVWRIPAHTEESRNNATGDQSQADSSSGTDSIAKSGATNSGKFVGTRSCQSSGKCCQDHRLRNPEQTRFARSLRWIRPAAHWCNWIERSSMSSSFPMAIRRARHRQGR